MRYSLAVAKISLETNQRFLKEIFSQKIRQLSMEEDFRFVTLIFAECQDQASFCDFSLEYGGCDLGVAKRLCQLTCSNCSGKQFRVKF